MSVQGMVGVLHLDGSPVDVTVVSAMAGQAPHRGSEPGVWHADGAALAQQRVTGPSTTVRPVERGGLISVSDVRLDDRAGLRAQLLARGLEVADDADDATLLLGAYRCWGRACPEHLYGDYAFAIWDRHSRQLFAARDPMGMRALYLRIEPRRRVLFATELKQLLAAPGVPREIDELGIAANLAGPYLPADRTLYAGIEQLPAGHAIGIDSRGSSRRWRHWQPKPADRLKLTDEEAGEAYRERLALAVRDRADTQAAVGISLSGGLDSTNLAALAGWLRQRGELTTPEVHTYSWRFTEIEGADERDVSDRVVAAFPIEGHAVDGDDGWPLSDFETASPDRDDPLRWPYQALIDRTRRQARADGVGIFLTGSRGDELTGDWAYDDLGLLLSGHLGEGWADLRRLAEAYGRTTAWALARLSFAELELRQPAMRRLRPHGSLGRSTAPWAPWIAAPFARRVGLGDLITEQHRPTRFGGLGRTTRYQRIAHPQSARLAVEAERSMARVGLVSADPYADRRLAQFVLALPAWQVQRRTAQKRLARGALDGIVPAEVRLSARKSIPHRLYDRGMRERATRTIDRLLTSPIAAEHGWIDAQAVREAHEAYRQAGQVPYDYWWVLTTEWWLRRWWT